MNRSESSSEFLSILNIAFYRFVDVPSLFTEFPGGFPELREAMIKACKARHLKGKILLSDEGINGCLAGTVPEIRTIQTYFEQFSIFSGMEYKESYSEFRPFKRMLVKLKKEIIPVGDSEVRPAQISGPRIAPKELKQWLDENRDFSFLDTRNKYEIGYGTFEKASHLGIKNFRQFEDELKKLPEEVKKRPMVMFCTGGIRCEKASLIALRNGINDVYQLDGGILRYFEEVGGTHYQGKCFVFDDRVALDSELKPEVDLPS